MYSFTNLEKYPNILAVCNCGRQFIPEEMYVCFTCSIALCRYCCNLEIAAFSCMNCLEAITPSDAITFKNRCSKCMECPTCKNILTITMCVDPQIPQFLNKLYFLCQFCFWDSKICGLAHEKIEDLLSSANKIHENRPMPNRDFNKLMIYYKDKMTSLEQHKKMNVRLKRKSISLVRQSHFHSSGNWSLPTFIEEQQKKEETLKKNMTEIEDHLQLPFFKMLKEEGKEGEQPHVDENIYDEAFPPLATELAAKNEASKITIMEQRIAYPNTLPSHIHEMYPQPVRLMTKKSRKCLKCLKYIIKPETEKFSSLTDFKLALFFIENCPRIVIKRISELKFNQECQVLLHFYNKTKNSLMIRLSDIPEENLRELGLSPATISKVEEFSLPVFDPYVMPKDGQAPMPMPSPRGRESMIRFEDMKHEAIDLVIRPSIENTKNNILKVGFMLNISLLADQTKIDLSCPIIIGLGTAS